MGKKETYTQEKMVNWYHPKMLLSIGMKAVISGTFGNYADRRELEAVLDNNIGKDWEELTRAYCGEDGKNEDIWIDLVNDTGDGFNSTFAIARCVAKKTLEFKDPAGGDPIVTQRGRILVFGGDEVYPFPTIEEYTNRFKIPFAAAAEDRAEINKEDNRPHLYAIPGNHDWYDGLGNFIKLFCQQRWIGIWSTKQHRSYFALPLPNRYWLWATDVQLASDIDGPQLKYFEEVAKTRMQPGDRVILVTAEPAWVYNKLKDGDRSFAKLEFFVENYIRSDTKDRPFSFKLAATLTGDLHHYARYSKQEEPDNGHQYITAGGGGAFMTETHCLIEKLEGIRERGTGNKTVRPEIYRKATFPSAAESRRLMFWNFVFPLKNWLFTLLLLCVYFIFFAALYSNLPGYFSGMSEGSERFGSFIEYTCRLLPHSLSSILLSLGVAGGFYAFADTKVAKPGKARIAGALHGLGQLVLIYLVMYFIGTCVLNNASSGMDWWLCLLKVLGYCAIGAIAAGFFFGTYLFISNRFGMHLDEASSSLACEDYKNFLRLRVHKDGVTIYPIGIRKVPRNWKTTPEEGDMDISSDKRYSFEGTDPEPFLIEPPIHIHNDKL